MSNPNAKAIVAAVIAFLSTLLATLQGRTDVETMRVVDWLIVVGAAVVAGLVVYQTPNKPTG
jgi:Flp pilus assembly protein protease CpaA